MRRSLSCGAVALAFMTGCGTAAISAPQAPSPAPGPPTPAETARFEEGLRTMARHDRANDWDPAACKATADLLLSADKGSDATPRYDAGLVYQRCGDDVQAKAQLHAALERDPKLYRAQASLALYATDGAELDATIADLRRAVVASRFQSVEAQVALATLQMRRRSTAADDDGADDLDRAKKNLHRALAIDDGYMPALNQLAIWHLERGRRGVEASEGGKKGASQALELAVLVCSQAIRKDPRYAPIHNTAGLVEVELGNLSRASTDFDQARRLDPGLVEAQMNFAALNLQVRGFAGAEEAYRKVLSLRPADYDARLGLALAIRGQIADANEVAFVDRAQKELMEAKRIAPDRPEAYYNEAILTQEYETKADGQAAQRTALLKAKGLFGTFLEKAERRAGFDGARERAKERMREIDQILGFLDKGAPGS